jgi:hypothetical protein
VAAEAAAAATKQQMPPQGRIPKNNIEVLSYYYSIIYILYNSTKLC